MNYLLKNKEPENMKDYPIKKLTAIYVATISVMLAGVHLFIALVEKSEMTVAASFALVPVALTYLYFPVAFRKKIKKEAFLSYILHSTTYLLVNISYWIHGFILYIQDADANEGALILSNNWMGVLLAMPLFWGIGLLIHTFGAWITDGFEDVQI